jgi:hypothetical protein
MYQLVSNYHDWLISLSRILIIGKEKDSRIEQSTYLTSFMNCGQFRQQIRILNSRVLYMNCFDNWDDSSQLSKWILNVSKFDSMTYLSHIVNCCWFVRWALQTGNSRKEAMVRTPWAEDDPTMKNRSVNMQHVFTSAMLAMINFFQSLYWFTEVA